MFSTKCFFVLGLFFFCPRHGLFLPTNHTNLHESLSMNKMATCSVARIFTNSIFSATLGNLSKLDCARHNSNKFGFALACTKIREIRGQKRDSLAKKISWASSTYHCTKFPSPVSSFWIYSRAAAFLPIRLYLSRELGKSLCRMRKKA